MLAVFNVLKETKFSILSNMCNRFAEGSRMRMIVISPRLPDSDLTIVIECACASDFRSVKLNVGLYASEYMTCMCGDELKNEDERKRVANSKPIPTVFLY